MNLNEMNDAWIAQGQKVSDLNDKINTSLLDDSVDEDAIKDLKAKRDQAKARRDEMKNQLEEMKAQEAVHTDNLKNQSVKDDKKMSDSIKFIKMFKDMAHGHITDVIKESVTDPGQTGNGGLLISNDEQTKINELLRQQANLQTLVTVESVSKPKGSRVVDKNEDLVAMPVVNEGDTLPDLDDPKLDRLSYAIKDHGGIFTATNDQLNDSDQNTLAWLEQKIAKYTGFSRSQDVLAVLPKMTKKATISSFDDIKDLENNTIDPSLMSGAIFLTNQSGFNILSKVKDAQGRYLLQADVSNPDVYRIGGKQVVWFADNIVPDDKSGNHPLYFGNFKEGIILFDRQAPTVDSTDIGGNAYTTNTTKVRVIDRYDVQVKDEKAIAVASFKTVANQEATTPADSGKTTDK